MTQRYAPPAFPQALDQDDDDVAWALSTGGVEWKRGAHADALVWLRRAIEAALDGNRAARARDLERQGRALQLALEAGWLGAPPHGASRVSVHEAGAGDGSDGLDSDPYGVVAVDLDLPPLEADQSLEEVTLENDLIEEYEEFDDADLIALSGGSSSEQPPASARIESRPLASTLPPFPNSESGLDSLPPEETTEPDLEPGPRFESSRGIESSRGGRSVTEPEVHSEPQVASNPSFPPASESAPPTSREPTPPPSELPPEVGGILLTNVPGLEDLPDEAQTHLARRVEMHTLAPDEEISAFGLVVVLEGSVAVMPAVADVAAAVARRGDPVFGQGHLEEGVAMRVVARSEGARVAAWLPAELDAAVRDCPWVRDELKNVGDRFQTLAGVAMGPLGENLDDMLRGLVIARCQVRRLLPGEIIATAGQPVNGMYVLGGGRIEIVTGPQEENVTQLGPGDFLFSAQILRGAPAPAMARAGKGGALVLFAERMVAHELMVSVPPLLEVFAR